MDNAYGRWARKRLGDFGIDWKAPLNENKILDGMYRFATDSQLQKNILKDPFFFNEPKMRPFIVFKRFGYRQASYIKDALWRETKRGNIFPILRLAAGGYFGGEFVIWGKNKIKATFTGEPVYRESEQYTWERFLSNVAATGSFGVMGDMLIPAEGDKKEQNLAAGEPPWYYKVAAKAGSSLEFAATPVILSDTKALIDKGKKVTEELAKYNDAGLVARRNVGGVFDMIGTLPRWGAARLDTKSQKEDRIERAMGDVKKKIFVAMRDGDDEKAMRLQKLWNDAHPQNPILMKDISRKALVKKYKADQKTLDELKSN
jgi:hypothetical protein